MTYGRKSITDSWTRTYSLIDFQYKKYKEPSRRKVECLLRLIDSVSGVLFEFESFPSSKKSRRMTPRDSSLHFRSLHQARLRILRRERINDERDEHD